MANGENFTGIMAEKHQKRPSKGILKTSSSFDKQDKSLKKGVPAPGSRKATKWDEMNIIATLHPADKDYGHMKIEEPKTPYNWEIGEEDEMDGTKQALDPELLNAKLEQDGGTLRRRSMTTSEESENSDQELTEEEQARRKVFKSKRKMHYNEFKVVEYARKLIKADEDALASDEEEEGDQGRGDGAEAACSSSTSGL